AKPAITLGLIRAGALQNATAAVPGAAQSYSIVCNWKIRIWGDSNAEAAISSGLIRAGVAQCYRG
ncbi:hypothetical protein L195_g023391, partial [Trifolium pratense]